MTRGMAGAVALAVAMQPCASAAQAAGDPAEKPDYSKYFVFHKDGVSREAAAADYAECVGYGTNVTNIEPGVQSTYVPYNAALSPLMNGIAGGIGGALGSLLADALFKGPQRKAMRRTVLRKCMAFKGYSRFGVTKTAWNQLDDGDDRDTINARFGDVAAGPVPAGAVLAP